MTDFDGAAQPRHRCGRGRVGIDVGGMGFQVLIPLKSTAVGKSRLERALPSIWRSRLARAMAVDTVIAVTAAALADRAIVIAEDAADGRELAAHAPVEVHLTSARGLNDAIREGCALPGVFGNDARTPPVAVLPADLPSLRPSELDEALTDAARLYAARVGLTVVADRHGTGTTLLAGKDAASLDPRYGPGSFAAHRAAGALALEVSATSGLRRDVDEWRDLADVTGTHTLDVLHELERNDVGDPANVGGTRP